MKRILFDIFIIAAVSGTLWYLYVNYSETVIESLFGPQNQVIYIENLAVSVGVADTDAERRQGLSGVESLNELEGKLFIFEAEDFYSIWMKDMLIPLDIIWINEDYKIVHIEEQVSPDTFPRSFVSDEPARFVLEVNSFFVDSFKVNEGDRVTIPAGMLPQDLRDKFTETE